MRKILLVFITITVSFSVQPHSFGWDPQPNNPFPGTAFGAAVPGLTKIIQCSETPQIPDDCVRQGGGQVICPEWTANDITWTYRTDGSVASLLSWCRNSWLPPTTQADDEDFRNRQQLAMAAATLESQIWNAAHPGLQKCITWGPIVHANGISTSSGGACANVVGSLADGSTKQVEPSALGNSNAATPVANSDTLTANTNSPSSPVVAEDYSDFGIGKPFTKVIKGKVSTSGCPTGYQAASNELSGAGLTECWPANAWSAWSVGGSTWSEFKTTKGSLDAQQAESQRIQINAIRALALQEAQKLANETIGIKRCSNWSGFGQNGQECSYIPLQNNFVGSLGQRVETATAGILPETYTVFSSIGITLSEWQNTETYTSLSCPSGYGKKSDIDLNGTATASDDRWIATCAVFITTNDSASVTSLETQTSVNAELDSVSALTLAAEAIQFSGSLSEISRISSALSLETSEANAITKVIAQFTSLKNTFKLVKVSLPSSPDLVEKATSLTPKVCTVKGLVVTPKRPGTCKLNFSFSGESGNSFETIKKVSFRK